jgi:hypothetical protein
MPDGRLRLRRAADSALLDPIRERVRNVTEIGVAAGQSLQMWHAYFANARLWGVDNYASREMRRVVRTLPRATVFIMGSSDAEKLQRLELANESMDVIIDDGDHYPPVQQATLRLWW